MRETFNFYFIAFNSFMAISILALAIVWAKERFLGKLSKIICKKHMEFFICWLNPPPPPPLTYGKSATFLCLSNDF